MTAPLSRREFLKLAGLLSLNYATPRYIQPDTFEASTDRQNVVIVVFDAWSAANISLFGYGRRTTPQLERLAEKAIVYHKHHAGAHFTTPGTASLLTGTTPWTHQTFSFNGSLPAALLQHNIFRAFDSYHRLAYSHNPLANTLLHQLMRDIDDFTPWEEQYLENDPLINSVFAKDYDVAAIGWNRAMKRLEEGYAYSLYLSQFYEDYKKKRVELLTDAYPRGIPNYDGLAFFTLEQTVAWVAGLLQAAPQPFLGYFHFLPPHDPYHTHVDFYDTFRSDNFHPPEKDGHILRGGHSIHKITEQRRWYDEFILHVDDQFARLYNQLEASGVLDNTWVILTSDHGEMFERGILAHNQPVYHRPIINVPLIVFPPGQKQRVDIYEQTSAIDLLPTLAHIAGLEHPAWAKGRVLPPFVKPPHPPRDLSTVHLQGRDPDGRASVASAMLVRGDYKLMWYFGYDQLETGEFIELFDTANDPEETHNLHPTENARATEMLNELNRSLKKLNPTS